MKTKTTVLCAVFAAVMCVFSVISVNIGPVPLTLALFGVMLISVILGTVKGIIAIAVYLLLGAVGLPVFAGFSGGIQCLAGPTGGYLWSYLFMALIIGLITKNLPAGRFISVLKIFIACVIAIAVCYALGTIQFMAVNKMDLAASLTYCVIPFIIPDLIKAVFASYIGYETRRALLRANLLEK